MAQIHTSTRYRPEIDGLRALAVLPVVLYHAALSFPGGYIGVDIFFVISGFLITTIIQKQLQQGTFSLRSFWERRIRRIFPALTVLILFTIAGSYYFLYPEAFKDFGKEVAAQATLVSNFYFAQQDGYFAAPSEFFPLLHTWSLAVEEQFYFLFPLLLIFLYKHYGSNTRITLTYLSVIALLSFSWSIYGVIHSPSNTFFLLPARAWELLLGSILAIWKPRHSWPTILNEILSWLSIAVILATLFHYTAETPFPGLAALPPCLAAGLLIFCNREQATSSAKLLSAKPLVYIGKISYSFYLWHWPIIVFANYSSTGELPITTKIVLVLASFLLACASYHFVETPFRIREMRRATIFRSFATVTSLFLVSGIIIYLGRGWPARFSPDVRQYAVAGGERSKLLKDDGLLDKQTLSTIPLNDSTSEIRPILLWGDSHAAYTAPALEELCKQQRCRIYASTKATVPPLLHGFSISKPIAVERNKATLEFIKKHNIKKVILIGRWDFYTSTEGEAHKPQSFYDNRNKTLETNQAFESCLKDTLDKLTALGVEIFILKQIPYQHQDPPRILANSLRFGTGPSSLGTPLTDHLALQKFPNTMFEKYIHPNITIIDPTPFFTRNSKTCYMAENGHSLYRDKDHISQYGARRLAPLFETIFSTEEQSSQLE